MLYMGIGGWTGFIPSALCPHARPQARSSSPRRKSPLNLIVECGEPQSQVLAGTQCLLLVNTGLESSPPTARSDVGP